LHRSGDPTLSCPPALLALGSVGGHAANMHPSVLLYIFIILIYLDKKSAMRLYTSLRSESKAKI
jgi:hypothetical protein